MSHAFGVAMFFRVQLCLEGVLVFAWTLEVAEHIVGRKCSVHSIEGVSVSREDPQPLGLDVQPKHNTKGGLAHLHALR